MVIGVASLVDAAWSFQGVTLPYYANIQCHESNENCPMQDEHETGVDSNAA
jgi:hypothetical protein